MHNGLGHQRCAYCSVYQSGPPGRGVTVWNCCHCGAGAMLYSTTSHCTSCEQHGVSDFSGERNFQQLENADHSPTPSAVRRGKREDSNEPPARADLTADEIPGTRDPQQQASSETRDQMRDLLDIKSLPEHQRGIASTVKNVSDAQTVVSCISSATTLVHPDRVEAFALGIMKFHSLGCLWPQLVGLCRTKKRCIHVIERLLKRYSKDLALVGQKVQASKVSGSQLCLTAARFVRRSRIHVAHKIWEAQFQDLESLERNRAVEVLSDTEVPHLEVDEDDIVPADDDLSFDSIEEVLFEKSPIFSLQANIKLLISLSNPKDNSTVYRISLSLNTFIGNTISSLYEPSLSPGYTRLRYTCVSLINLISSLPFLLLLHSADCNDLR